MFTYNDGNLKKYVSKNKLKQKMIFNFNKMLVNIISKEVIARTNGNSTVKVADVGCGEGFITNLIYENIKGIELIGIEYTKEALEIARKNNPYIEYTQGDIYNLEITGVNIALCTEVLEHLEYPYKAIKNLLNILDDNGVLIISVPNEPWFCLGNLLALKNITRLGNPIDHINHWTYGKFKKMIKENCNNGEKADFYKSFPWSIAVIKKV